MAFFLVDSKRLYRSSEKEEESRCLVSTSSTKRDQAFSSRSRAVTAKKCTKKRDARAQLLFCQESKPIAFIPFSLTSGAIIVA